MLSTIEYNVTVPIGDKSGFYRWDLLGVRHTINNTVETQWTTVPIMGGIDCYYSNNYWYEQLLHKCTYDSSLCLSIFSFVISTITLSNIVVDHHRHWLALGVHCDNYARARFSYLAFSNGSSVVYYGMIFPNILGCVCGKIIYIAMGQILSLITWLVYM